MNEWIPVTEKLPDRNIDKPYLITVSGRPIPFIAYYAENKWINAYQLEYRDVLAWKPLSEIYKPVVKKYRWRLSPKGYGGLREMYLTAISPALLVGEWNGVIDNNRQKNVFTEEEFNFLADRWEFDKGIFTKEEIPGEVNG